MAKRRSDWETRPGARFLRWMREGFTGLDDGIEASVVSPAPAAAAHGDLQRELYDQDRHERDAALTRMGQRDLTRWANTRGRRRMARLYTALALTLGFLIIFFLLETVAEMPRFGDAASPVHNEVSARYIGRGLEETGAVNLVAGMILDYRAFDTLGESTVLFIAACAVLILLRIDHDEQGNPVLERIAEDADDRHYEPKNDRVLQAGAMLLTPLVFLFGIYIILNGHLSPGGGFSGGAIISAGLILYLNAFGFGKAGRFFTYKTFQWTSFGALTFYALAKAYSFYCGANGLESGIPLGVPGAILSGGLIMPLNVAVGLVVACTMYIFYALFRKGGL
ncbi:MAG TPA: hydrogen gas-evolving membrane-bound hydrogenase subunit E [Candidatus Limnocylindria bacterium]|nr:hydrogen gas-evolving membrane-bound hydrogenase subunit E [Candidatus Limnocylindria bacterium]